MFISSTKEIQQELRGEMISGGDFWSGGELTGSMESQEIRGEIIWPLDFCHSGMHHGCMVVGYFRAESHTPGRSQGYLENTQYKLWADMKYLLGHQVRAELGSI